MLPEDFSFRGFEGRNSLGALPGIIHFSMSFRNAIRRGFMPPLDLFNSFVATCRDDIDEASQGFLDIETQGVDWNAGESVGAILTWPNFELEPPEYKRLIAFINKRYGRVEIEDYGATDYSQWFLRCFEISRQDTK